MMLRFNSLFDYVFGAEGASERGHLRPRWLWLRALGLIFFSAFYSLLFQIRGLIGPDGILPAGRYLSALHEQAGARAYWYVPSLLWLSSGNHALMAISWVGLIASVLLVLNFWPRGTLQKGRRPSITASALSRDTFTPAGRERGDGAPQALIADP